MGKLNNIFGKLFDYSLFFSKKENKHQNKNKPCRAYRFHINYQNINVSKIFFLETKTIIFHVFNNLKNSFEMKMGKKFKNLINFNSMFIVYIKITI